MGATHAVLEFPEHDRKKFAEMGFSEGDHIFSNTASVSKTYSDRTSMNKVWIQGKIEKSSLPMRRSTPLCFSYAIYVEGDSEGKDLNGERLYVHDYWPIHATGPRGNNPCSYRMYEAKSMGERTFWCGSTMVAGGRLQIQIPYGGGRQLDATKRVTFQKFDCR